MLSAWVRSACLLVLSAPAWFAAAHADVTQTLDSVDAITQQSVREMRFGDPKRDSVQPNDFLTPIAASAGSGLSFAACQRAANRDLYCLFNSYVGADGKLTQPVRRWSESGTSEDLFSCTNPQLGLDTRRANPCTTLTVDLVGNIWLGGRDGTVHSVIKVVEIPQVGGSCEKSPLPAGTTPSLTDNDGPFKKLLSDSSGSSDFCFRRYATGRPVIVDMTAIDDRVGAGFQVVSGSTTLGGGAGVLLLEDRKTAVFVADPKNSSGLMLNPVAPVEIASGKSGWGLVGSESVQSAALMQLDCTASGNTQCFGAGDKKVNFVLVTTSTGKVIAKRTDPLAAPSVAFPAEVSCNAAVEPQFWVRVSPQSGQIYLGDRGCSVIRQLKTAVAPSLVKPTPAVDLSTQPVTPSATLPLDTLNTVSVSPGLGFDLNDCFGDDCVFVQDTNGNAVGAKISAVVIDQQTGQSGLTVFRIEGIPDCRNYAANDQNRPVICNTPGVVTSVNGVDEFLDVAKLLPLEVRSLFNDSTSPTLADLKLLISPQYRARPPCDPTGGPAGCVATGGNTFGAFFGRTEDNTAGSSVVFRDTFGLKFDIGQLNNGSPVRCGFQNSTRPRTPAEWDVIVTSSERTKTANIIANGQSSSFNTALSHSEMLVNTFCENPTSGSGDRWSLYAYGLMLNDTSTGAFGVLLDRLFDELEQARKLTACTNFSEDGNVDQPLSPSVCAALAADWTNARDKLNKCIDATKDPKQSAGDQTCQAFTSQFEAYRSELKSASINWYPVPTGFVADRANRLGELKARTDVIRYILACQFLPSAGMTSTQCTLPPPW